MLGSVVFIVALTLSSGEHYQVPTQFFDNQVQCMDAAMTLSYTYRRADLKSYSLKCLKTVPEVEEKE
jgi:hypothetical protein